jgi:hypothetical protein
MMIDKNKLKKYGEFLKETLDPYKLKYSLKSINKLPEDVVTIPGDLKDLSEVLTDMLENIELPYNNIINFGGIEIELKIISSNRNYSNIDWVNFLKGDFEIIIEAENNFDINYIVSSIIHEIRHMIDFTDSRMNSGFSSFDIDKNLRKYNIENYNEFFRLVYLSLEHELIARNNQIYPYIKFKNITKQESINILKNSFIYKSLEKLKDFNYTDFINRFETDELIDITNSFIKNCLYDFDFEVSDEIDLNNFYKIWSEYFNTIGNKWMNILNKEVDYIYERKVFKLEYLIDYKNIISDIWIVLKK